MKIFQRKNPCGKAVAGASVPAHGTRGLCDDALCAAGDAA